MIADLKNSIVFLHGLSGSGKGEIQRQITDAYHSGGYEVIYGSSGDLLRAGFADPYISTRLLKGYYFDTLEPIIPGLEAIFRKYITEWRENDKKVLLILDGVIRRTDFINAEGKQIPTQVDQLAQCLDNVLLTLTKDDPSLLEYFPEYSGQINPDERVHKTAFALRGATHIITDIRPEDAENQMKARAGKEVRSIRTQIAELSSQGLLSEDKLDTVTIQTETIEEIINGNYPLSKDKIIYNDDLSQEEQLMPTTVDLNVALNKAKNELAKSAGVQGESVTLSTIYKTLGIKTAIREDDITPMGRRNRINNFARQTPEGSATAYEPGFAAVALAELGFELTSDISFKPISPNCYVVENGQSRGITLDEFRNQTSVLAKDLYLHTETERLLANEGREGFRRGKES